MLFLGPPIVRRSDQQAFIEEIQNKQNIATREVYYERRESKPEKERKHNDKEIVPGN